MRVKDVDFERQQIMIRDGKGEKNRPVPLPKKLAPHLTNQMEFVRQQHAGDLAMGSG